MSASAIPEKYDCGKCEEPEEPWNSDLEPIISEKPEMSYNDDDDDSIVSDDESEYDPNNDI